MQRRGELDRVVAKQRVTHQESGTMASIDELSSMSCVHEKSRVSRAAMASRCAPIRDAGATAAASSA
jgi:hypothetical protein